MRNCLFAFIFCPTLLSAQVITTIAGGGIGGDGGPATSASLYDPVGMAIDYKGNLFIAECLAHDIRKVDSTGVITTYAGISGAAGFSGDGGAATNAKFNQPSGIAVDSLGNLFIADALNHRVRKVNANTGIVTTICGNGTAGLTGDGGLANAATLDFPNSVLFDKLGNLYIVSAIHSKIRKINSAGIISTIAGTGISGDSGDGGMATNATIQPSNIGFDNIGNLYMNDEGNSIVRKINTSGIISHFAGDSGHYLYNGDGINALTANFESSWIAIDLNGHLCIADHWNNRVRMIDDAGVIHTIAGNGTPGSTGDGGLATSAKLHSPGGLIFDMCGNLYIAQVNQPRIRKVTFNTPPCTYLGVEEIDKSDITVYPNPATDELHIDVSVNVEYVLLNITGIIEQTGTLKEGSNSVPVGSLPAGLHMLVLIDEEGRKIVEKIVKE